MLKRTYLLSFFLVLALVFTACGTDDDTTNQDVVVGQDVVEETAEANADMAEEEAQMAENTAEENAEMTEDVAETDPTISEDSADAMEETAEENTEMVEDNAEANAEMTENAAEAQAETTEDMTEDTAAEADVAGSEETGAVAENTQSSEEGVIPPTGVFNLNRLSSFDAFEVYNNNDEQVGDIEAVIIDMKSSEIKYLVLGVGGFLGLGEKSVAVPYQALTVNQPVLVEGSTEETVQQLPHIFVLDINAETLENAPEINLDLLENPLTLEEQQAAEANADGEAVTFEEQEQEILTFWENELGLMDHEAKTTTQAETAETTETTSADAHMTDPGTSNYILDNELLGATIVDSSDPMKDGMEEPGIDEMEEASGDDIDMTVEEDDVAAKFEESDELGYVQDVTTDITTGKVNYVVVDLNDDGLNTQTETASDEVYSNELTPIPLSMLHWNAEDETLSYQGSQSLKDAPTITFESFQDVDLDPNWDLDIDTFWNENTMDVDAEKTE